LIKSLYNHMHIYQESQQLIVSDSLDASDDRHYHQLTIDVSWSFAAYCRHVKQELKSNPPGGPAPGLFCRLFLSESVIRRSASSASNCYAAPCLGLVSAGARAKCAARGMRRMAMCMRPDAAGERM
jgi:hypothetical protein